MMNISTLQKQQLGIMLEMQSKNSERRVQAKCKRDEKNKEGNCMEKGYGGSKLSFGTVSSRP